MKRIDCLRRLRESVSDELMVVGISNVNYEWRRLSDRPADLFIGSLGQAAAVGIGIALALPHRRVIVLESDGSMLHDVPALTLLGLHRPPNLTMYVFDDGIYGVGTYSEPTATAAHTDLAGLARASGVVSATAVNDLEGFERQVEQRTGEGQAAGPHMAVVRVPKDPEALDLPRPRMDYLENKYRFIRHIEKTEGVKILPPVH
jgi:sulfopyruvate decarboxylase subunit beta